MARTVQECYDYIVSNLETEFASVGITITPATWSKRNLIRNLCYIYAIAQSLSEQLQDVAIAKMEAIQRVSSPATAAWLQDAVFKFQYSSTTPQNLSIIGGVAQYAIVNEALRIVTACSVSNSVTGTVYIKVAKGSPLAALSAPEISALQTYVDQKGAAGITYVVSSSNPDRLYLEGSVYYNGIYSSVISDAVIDALDAWLADLSVNNFNGEVKVTDIINVIRAVDGVNDFVPTRIAARYSSQSLFGGIDLVSGSDILSRKYNTGAGYIIQEDTSSNTFADKLTFIAE